MTPDRRPAPRPATLEDVAARAGVSRATASRVLNDHPRVAEPTRRAVEAAVAELGYAPNRAARSLAAQRHDTVAVVVSEPSARIFGDPFFASTIRGAAAALSETRYQLVLLMTQDDADRARAERYLLRHNADGVLVLSAHAADPLTAHLAEAGIPCVLAGRPPFPVAGAVTPPPVTVPPGTASGAPATSGEHDEDRAPDGGTSGPDDAGWPTGAAVDEPGDGLGSAGLDDGPRAPGYVDADNIGGARQAVTYLLEQGRTTVATVAGPSDMSPGIDRRAGWEQALRDAGLTPDPSLVAPGDFTRAGGEAAAAALLARHPDVDAIFAASDLMALGVLDALREAGRRVPEDIAVIGFDDVDLASIANPPLTTVRQPLEKIGWHMADHLVAQLDGGVDPTGLVLPTELIIRTSA